MMFNFISKVSLILLLSFLSALCLLPSVLSDGETFNVSYQTALSSAVGSTNFSYGNCFHLNPSPSDYYLLEAVHRYTGEGATQCYLYNYSTQTRISSVVTLSTCKGGVSCWNFSSQSIHLAKNNSYCVLCTHNGANRNLQYKTSSLPSSKSLINFTFGASIPGSWTQTTAHSWNTIILKNTSSVPPPSLSPLLKVSLFNTSGSRKSTFSPGEGFFVSLAASWNNGTNISSASCNVSLQNVSLEVAADSNNFSVCPSGCSVSGVYTDSFSLSSAPSRYLDVIHFSVCHPGSNLNKVLTFNFSCASGGSVFLLNGSDVPACTGSPFFFSLETDSCISDTSTTLKISYDGSFLRRPEISNLFIDRFVSSDLMTNIPYSSPDHAFITDHEHEYHFPSVYPVSASCFIPSSAVSVSNSSLLSLVDVSPLIVPFHVNNSVNEVSMGDNISFGDSPFGFSFTVVHPSLSWVFFSLSNSSGVVFSLNSTGNFFPFIPSDSFRDFSANPFNISIKSGNLAGFTSSYSASFSVYDLVTPLCVGFSDVSVQNDSFYNFSIDCYDEAFYSLNISCDSGFSHYVGGLSDPTFHYSNSTLILKSTTCGLEWCDGHTKFALSKSSFYSLTKDKGVSFFTVTKGNKANVTFSPKGGVSPSSVEIIKKVDRISFKYTFQKGSKGKRSFVYSTSDAAVFLDDPMYKGWIVDPVSRTWFDSEISNDPSAVVSVEKISYNEWLVVVDSDLDVLEFESIGELNCGSGTFRITAVPLIPGVFSKIENVQLYSFLLLFWVLFLVLTLILKGPNGKTIQFLNILQMLFGFVVGSLWMGVYFLLGFPVVIIAVGFFVTLILYEK